MGKFKNNYVISFHCLKVAWRTGAFTSPLHLTVLCKSQISLICPCIPTDLSPSVPLPAPAQLLNNLFLLQQPYTLFPPTHTLCFLLSSSIPLEDQYYSNSCTAAAACPMPWCHPCWNIVHLPSALIQTRCLHGGCVLSDVGVPNSGNGVFVIKWHLHLIQSQPLPIFTSGTPWVGWGRYLAIVNVFLFHELVQSPL